MHIYLRQQKVVLRNKNLPLGRRAILLIAYPVLNALSAPFYWWLGLSYQQMHDDIESLGEKW